MGATGHGQKSQNPDGSREKFACFSPQCVYSKRICSQLIVIILDKIPKDGEVICR